MQREIMLKTLLYTLKESSENGKRYCFILGAGVSKSSGIPTGLELSKRWLEELHKMYTDSELNQLQNNIGISDISLISENYFNIYDLRFYPEYSNGYAYLEKVMECAQPSAGYYPLAKQLTTTENNLVITTNFDSLIEDALFVYTDKKPLVVNHESLAGYIDTTVNRPLIAKIHRGMFFKPLNRQKEIEGLSIEWKNVLTKVFQTYTPIVIGYAGGDHSLMSFLQDESLCLDGLYWCYYKYDSISEEIQNLINKKRGYLVAIEGFDEMMYMLADAFSYEDPAEHIMKTAEEKQSLYKHQTDDIITRMQQISNPTPAQIEIKISLESLLRQQIEQLEEKISKTPNNSVLYAALGNIYYHQGKYQEALSSYQKAIALRPNTAEYYNGVGVIYGAMNEPDEAFKYYSTALELKPTLREAWLNRGHLYGKIGKHHEAIQNYTEALNLNAEDEVVLSDRGVSFLASGKYQEAISDLNKAIELKPDYQKAHYNLGAVYTNIKEYMKAIKEFDIAIELDKNYINPHLAKAKIFYATNELQKALSEIKKVIELDNTCADSFFWRAEIYLKMANYKESFADINTALKLSPNNTEYIQLRNVIQKKLHD